MKTKEEKKRLVEIRKKDKLAKVEERKRCEKAIQEDIARDFLFLAKSSGEEILRKLWLYVTRLIALMEFSQEKDQGKEGLWWARLADLKKIRKYLLAYDLKYPFLERENKK